MKVIVLAAGQVANSQRPLCSRVVSVVEAKVGLGVERRQIPVPDQVPDSSPVQRRQAQLRHLVVRER